MKDEKAIARAHDVFDPLAITYLTRPGVDIGPMFGAEGLRIRGKVFAFVVSDGSLVLKVPAARATEIAADGRGIGKMVMRQRELREWLWAPLAASEHWEGLLAEAFDYVDAITPG